MYTRKWRLLIITLSFLSNTWIMRNPLGLRQWKEMQVLDSYFWVNELRATSADFGINCMFAACLGNPSHGHKLMLHRQNFFSNSGRRAVAAPAVIWRRYSRVSLCFLLSQRVHPMSRRYYLAPEQHLQLYYYGIHHLIYPDALQQFVRLEAMYSVYHRKHTHSN